MGSDLNMQEIWKDINEYEGKYQISNLGRVKSLNYARRKQERILKPGIQKKTGYISVTLLKERKKKTKTIHRLVAETFIPNPENLHQINHKDENKQNNCVDNLEWCSAKYNSNYGHRNEKISKKLKFGG